MRLREHLFLMAAGSGTLLGGQRPGKLRWAYNARGADRHLIPGWRLSEIGAPGTATGGIAYVFTHSGTVSALRAVP